MASDIRRVDGTTDIPSTVLQAGTRPGRGVTDEMPPAYDQVLADDHGSAEETVGPQAEMEQLQHQERAPPTPPLGGSRVLSGAPDDDGGGGGGMAMEQPNTQMDADLALALQLEAQQQAAQGPRTRRRRGRAPQVDSPEKLNWLIHLAYIRKDYEECKKLVEHQLKETSGSCEYALYVNGLLLRHEGKMDDSLEFFQKAMYLNPHHKDNAKQVARSLFLMSRHRAAIAVYEQILAAGVRDWHILHNMGVCFSYTENLDTAQRYLEEALEMHKHDVTFLQLGKVLLQQDQTEAAIRTYETALKLSPENSDILTTLGLLYLETSQTRKAFDLFGSALTYNPRDASGLMGAGFIIQEYEDYDVALIKYRVAAAMTPESAEMWNNIGMCFFGKGNLVAAISCLKKAVYLAPAQWKISYNLGLVHLYSKQYVSAFHFMSAAVNFQSSLRIEHGLSYMLLGLSLMHLEDLPNACKALSKAADLDRANPMILLNCAAVLYKQGDMQAAASQLTLYEKALREKGDAIDGDEKEQMEQLSKELMPKIHMGA